MEDPEVPPADRIVVPAHDGGGSSEVSTVNSCNDSEGLEPLNHLLSLTSLPILLFSL